MELLTKSFSIKAAEGVDGEVVAYVSTFGNKDRAGDIVMPGAFDEFVASFDPQVKKLPMFYNHDSDAIIGSWNAFEIDEHGLKGVGSINLKSVRGSEIYEYVKQKTLTQVSIGYRVRDFEFNGDGVRLLKNIDLGETSIVPFPANTQAQILSVKSEDGLIEVKALKSVLKDAGLNRNEIEALFNGGFTGLKNLRQEETDLSDLINILTDFKL